MKKYLGIDIGGTNTKLGIVTEDGKLIEKVKYATAQLEENRNYLSGFIERLQTFLNAHPDIEPVIGIAIPGTLSSDRRSTIDIQNIPSLSHKNIIDILERSFPGKKFIMENDAKVAALGELHFSGATHPDDFAFMTLGTGIGGAYIKNGKIFKGSCGNAMEVGHMFAGSKRTVEELIGKKGIVEKAKKLISKKKRSTPGLYHKENLTAKDIEKAALDGDKLAQKVFRKFGKELGRCIVAIVRTLDVHYIIIGGGVADTFEFMKPTMLAIINKNLPPYYTHDMKVELAKLENEAGIYGAAALCFANEMKAALAH